MERIRKIRNGKLLASSANKYESLRGAKGPTAYVPLTAGGATFELRTAVSPVGLMPAVRNLVHEVDNNLPIIRMRTQSDAIDRLLFNERLVARLFGLFGALGLMLTCVGLYGLLSYNVTLRTREIGIRTALGAQRRDVLVLVLWQGLVLVIVGVTLGAAAATGVTRLLESLLYGVRPTDPFTFALTAALADRDWSGCQFTACTSCDARGPNDGTALRVESVPAGLSFSSVSMLQVESKPTCCQQTNAPIEWE